VIRVSIVFLMLLSMVFVTQACVTSDNTKSESEQEIVQKTP
jgi:hypothetical protein